MKENPTSQQHTPTTQSSGGSVGSGGGGGIVTHDDDGDEVRPYYIDTASAVHDIHTADPSFYPIIPTSYAQLSLCLTITLSTII